MTYICKKPLISVVTVCRNAEGTIKRTIDSVIHQSFKNIEYIIVDGQSTDNTYEIVCDYDNDFEEAGIKYIHISEKDNGIFDAMNKAIAMVSGEWVCFMNADDCFHDNKVLETVFYNRISEYENVDVIYGDTVRIGKDSREIGKGKDIDTILLNMPFCHQSSFTRSQILKKYKFDLKYRVADYNLFLRLYINKHIFAYVDCIIADYSLLGYSNKEKYLTYLGTVDIKHDLGLLNKYSIKRKIYNWYFRQLLDEDAVFHSIVLGVDNKISRRAK